MDMIDRSLTLYFGIGHFMGKIGYNEVLEALTWLISQTDIKAIQFTRTNCLITFQNIGSKQVIKNNGIEINRKHIKLVEAEQNITIVVLKDAPVEMPDQVVCEQMSKFGKIVPGSYERGIMRGTGIETGNRYIKLMNVIAEIPEETKIGQYTIRLITPQNPAEKEKICYVCKIPGHYARDCDDAPKVFRGARDELSNFYEPRDGNKIVYKGHEYATTEHAFQVARAKYHGAEWLAKEMMTLSKAWMVKNLVRQNRNTLASRGWDEIKEAEMWGILQAKAVYCKEYKDALMKSGSRILVEGTENPYWASGLSKNETIKTLPNAWPGNNVLGKMHMRLREELQRNAVEKEPVFRFGREEFPGVNETNPENEHPSSEVLPSIEEHVHQRTDLNADTKQPPVENEKEKVNTQEPSSLVSQREEEGHSEGNKPSPRLLILGDSLLAGIQSLSEDTHVVAQRGATLTDSLHELIGAATQKINMECITDVVLALGTNDVSIHVDEPEDGIIGLNSTVDELREMFPSVNIHATGILPRKGKKEVMQRFNDCADTINRYSKKQAELDISRNFINTESRMSTHGKHLKQYYSASDPRGVHLNTDGQWKLFRAIEAGVRDYAFQKVIKEQRFANTPARNKRGLSSSSSPPSGKKPPKRQNIN